MKRWLVAAWVLAWTPFVVTGCGGGAERSADAVETARLSLVDCTTYNGYTAALAEATVDCTGTIGPGSFSVDALGLLSRNFSACTIAGAGDTLLRIDRLLSL